MAIIQLQRGIAETGRIRIGHQVEYQKDGKRRTRPEKLGTFRLTSPDRFRIEQAAELYGGEVAEWQSPAGKQWEVVTTTDTLDVVVPPADLAFSQWYELWSAGGCVRRCDGATEQNTQGPCLCDPERRAAGDEDQCDVHTRLSVLLRDLPGFGTWRLDTQGYYAAVELAGTVEILSQAAGMGRLLPARLRLEQRQVKRKRQTRNFAVPVLDVEVAPAALLAGQASTLALEDATTPRPPLTPVPQLESAPSIAEQASPPAPRPRNGRSAPEIPSSGRQRAAGDAHPPDPSEDVVEGEYEAPQPAQEAAEPARRPRRQPEPEAAEAAEEAPRRPRRTPEAEKGLDYWNARVHAAAGEHGIKHDGLRLIAAAYCLIPVDEIRAFTSKDLDVPAWEGIDAVLRSLPDDVKGEDLDADLDLISEWIWPKAKAKGLDSWDAIDAVVVAATGKQPDQLEVPEWIAFGIRLEQGDYDARQAAAS